MSELSPSEMKQIGGGSVKDAVGVAAACLGGYGQLAFYALGSGPALAAPMVGGILAMGTLQCGGAAIAAY